MAKKVEKTEKPSKKVVNISTSDTTTTKAHADKPRKQRRWTKPFRATGRYLKGAWQELRQVHWPNRRQTWALTVAVLVFSLFLGAIIFLLDFGFTYLFKEVIL